ncbi:MAG: hypothetical protein M4579_000430 [Chaenotheca gracillima]|nr:MAG: hypothetical protein M4579_000430 [Chaenotheca gracillima]
MALNFFGSGSSPVKLFEIRYLTTPEWQKTLWHLGFIDLYLLYRVPNVLILRGSANEAGSTELHGALVLCLSEPYSCRNIKLSLEGTSRVGILDVAGTMTPSRSRMLKEKSVILDETWNFVDQSRTKSDVLEPGNYEWPFHLVIPGNTPESAEGLRDSWIVYRLKATIERGRLAHDVVARKPLRLVRVPSPAELEVAHDRFVENTWTGKVDYRFSVASGLQIFGSSIRVDLKLAPLAKGLTIGNIKVAIMETQQFRIREHKYKVKREVTSDIFHVDGEPQIIEETGQDGWEMPCVVNLPRRLANCLPNINAKGIEITHSAQITVDIHNEDGHVSEVIASIGIHIYISPDFMVDESNQLSNPAPSNDAIQRQLQNDSSAPPRYEQRELDQLWSGIDPALYTPAGGRSGVASPLLNRSRNSSMENLTSLTAMNHSTAGQTGMVPPQLLSNRLQSVQRTNGGTISPTALPEREEVGSGPSSLPRSPDAVGSQQRPVSLNATRPGSYEGDLFEHLEHAREHAQEELCKVPSYRTAVRSSIPDTANADLPNYDAATSSYREENMIRSPVPAHLSSQLRDPRGLRPRV